MRKYGKVDANQKQIVDQLRQIHGISVVSISSMGDGIPDIIVGYKARTYLFEIKDGDKPPSQKKLTEEEQKFFDMWTGHVSKCENLDQILKEIGIK
jgi:Holliday junction resolvase